MSDLMTSISLAGISGFSDKGHKSRREMIDHYRRYASAQKKEAERILSAADEEFLVEQHTGVYVRRNIVRIDK